MPRQETVTLSPDVVRYTRHAMQMTQEEFGAYLGVEANTVYRWEAGVHLPVGRKAKEIVKRYSAAVRNAKAAGQEVPSHPAVATEGDHGDADSHQPAKYRGVLAFAAEADWSYR